MVCCHLTFHAWPVGQLSCFLPGLRGSQRESERAITLFSNTSKWRKTGVKVWDGVLGQQGSETSVSRGWTDTSQEDQLLCSLSSVCKPETGSSKLTSRVWVALKRWSVRRCYDQYIDKLAAGKWHRMHFWYMLLYHHKWCDHHLHILLGASQIFGEATNS